MHMFSNFSFESILSILSFAVAVGGLYPALHLNDSKKKIIIIIVLTFIIATSMMAFINIKKHDSYVEFVSTEIVEKIGPSSVTLDYLNEEVYNTDYGIISEALDYLIKNGRVGYKTLVLRDDTGKSFNVTGFYLKTELK